MRIRTVVLVLFWGGVSAYTSGSMESFQDRIAVLVDLLSRGLHPQITAELVAEWSPKLEAARASVTATNAALASPVVRQTVLERSYVSVARRLQSALAAVKRDLKSEGLTEPQIHEIIPDRPRPSAKPNMDEPQIPVVTGPVSG